MPNAPVRLALAVFAAGGAWTATAAESPCSSVAAEQAVAAIAAPRDTIQAAVANNDMDTDLAPTTSAAIVALKRELVTLVDAQVACLAPGKTTVPESLEAALEAAVAPAGAKPDDAAIGFGASVFDDNPLLSVIAQIGIPCGADALWLVYARDGERWRRVLTWTSPPYARVDGAWGSFQVAVSPRDADGRWFAAASHIRPWCSSTWSTIDYEILRPGTDANAPTVVLKNSDSLWWGGDDTGRLSADARHVELRFHGASIDSGVHNREYVRRYRVDGSTATRVAPFAASARDFVEEWIVSPWTLARPWSAPARIDALRAAHATLHAQREKYESVEFGATTACADATQIELRHDESETSTFFRVAGKSDYVMAAVADHGDPACDDAIPAESTE